MKQDFTIWRNQILQNPRDYLKKLRENPDLAKEFDILFDFSLLDELTERDEAEGRCTFTLPGMAFARDGSGGEYHLLEDGSIGYYSSEGEAGRLAESMDDLFSLIMRTPKHWRNTDRGSVISTWKILIWTAGGGLLMPSASLPMRLWPPFWSGSAKRRSASLCIGVCSMRTTAA